MICEVALMPVRKEHIGQHSVRLSRSVSLTRSPPDR